MRKTMVLLTAALALAAGQAWALDLAGYAVDQVLTKAQRASMVNNGGYPASPCDDTACKKAVKLGDVTGVVVVNVNDHGKIGKVTVTVDGSEWTPLLVAARNKYGLPTTHEGEDGKSDLGVVWIWVSKKWDGGATLIERCPPDMSPCLSISAGWWREPGVNYDKMKL